MAPLPAPSDRHRAGRRFLTGLLGVGGGFLLVPAVIVINSAAGLVPYLDAGTGGVLDWSIVAPFALAASLPAGRLARRLPASRLRRGFAVLVRVVAAGVAAGSLTDLLA